MTHEDVEGNVRGLKWGEPQDAARRFARVLANHGVEKGDRVAMLLPPTPETASAFFGAYAIGGRLPSRFVPYRGNGIRHRRNNSHANAGVTNKANPEPIAPSRLDPVSVP